MESRKEQRHEISGVLLFAVAVLLGLSYYLPLSVTGSLGKILRGVRRLKQSRKLRKTGR